MEPRIQYAKTSDGVNIAYAVFGTGPPIVFAGNIFGNIHWYKSFTTWTRVYDTLVALGWSVLTYDGRGSGASGRDIEDHSLEGRLRDLDAVIERAGPARFPLCGVVQGSPTAIAYAALHAGRVSHLILSNGFASGREVYQRVPAMRLSQQTLDMAEDEWEFHLQTLAHATSGYSNPEEARALLAMFRAGMKPTDYLAYRRAAIEIDVSELLPQIRAPSLVIVDTSGPAVASPPLSQQLATQIPNARYVETDDMPKVMNEFLREGEEAATLKPESAAVEPTALRTVLFTDIVGHTEMMQRLGDAKGREVLREHERVTREALNRHGGTEVKTDGDSFMASFASVSAGVECAVALQRAFARYSDTAAEPIVVRIGLNVGEPIEEDGDYFGSAVILAARIKDQAGGGEILVPEAVRHLLAGKSFLFSDRGDVALRGFEDSVRLYEVRWREGR